MTEQKLVADFRFAVNSSFIKSHVITIPSRWYKGMNEFGLGDAINAAVTYGAGAPMKGSIRSGWRAGGRYYQVRMNSADANRELGQLRMGAALRVRVLKTAQERLVEMT